MGPKSFKNDTETGIIFKGDVLDSNSEYCVHDNEAHTSNCKFDRINISKDVRNVPDFELRSIDKQAKNR